jgi:hypothetical protein
VTDVNRLAVYPNPAVNRLFMNGMKVNTSFEVWDITGKVVLQGSYNGTGIPIDNLETGSYIVKSTKDNLTARFMKL